MTSIAPLASLSDRIAEIRAKWPWFVALGIGLILLGILAAINLFAATIASVLFVGALMLIAGVSQLVHAFQAKGWSNILHWVLSGVIYAAAGVLAFANPVLASAVLTLFLAAMLMIAGMLRIWVGMKAGSHNRSGWIVAGGVLTLVTGVVIAAGWPVSSLWVLGLMLAVDLTFQGWCLLAFGLALRSRGA